MTTTAPTTDLEIVAAVSTWWHRNLGGHAAGRSTLRSNLRRQPDAALLLEPAVGELIDQVSRLRDRQIGFKECTALLGLVRLLAEVQSDAATPLPQKISGANLSSARLRTLLTAKDQRAFATSLTRVLPVLGREVNIRSIARIFLSWTFEDTRKRLAFDIHSYGKK